MGFEDTDCRPSLSCICMAQIHKCDGGYGLCAESVPQSTQVVGVCWAWHGKGPCIRRCSGLDQFLGRDHKQSVRLAGETR